ncbi:hypothetical protein PROFUN_13901 [Planoprotostelium fungivorum]|uniref:Uncharacterized protein n=1 Tax=Planoprotostelium fungivorum TaxID=1890364 RepID=A0A2P6N2U3_9EUKA|nr:hypothetical protein PROFUN_13901 [Planoprotostelium fungivorum]
MEEDNLHDVGTEHALTEIEALTGGGEIEATDLEEPHDLDENETNVMMFESHADVESFHFNMPEESIQMEVKPPKRISKKKQRATTDPDKKRGRPNVPLSEHSNPSVKYRRISDTVDRLTNEPGFVKKMIKSEWGRKEFFDSHAAWHAKMIDNIAETMKKLPPTSPLRKQIILLIGDDVPAGVLAKLLQISEKTIYRSRKPENSGKNSMMIPYPITISSTPDMKPPRKPRVKKMNNPTVLSSASIPIEQLPPLTPSATNQDNGMSSLHLHVPTMSHGYLPFGLSHQGMMSSSWNGNKSDAMMHPHKKLKRLQMIDRGDEHDRDDGYEPVRKWYKPFPLYSDLRIMDMIGYGLKKNPYMDVEQSGLSDTYADSRRSHRRGG